MGRKKGGSNRRWTAEERLKYVLLCDNQHFTVRQVARDYNIPYGTLKGWVQRYREGDRCFHRHHQSGKPLPFLRERRVPNGVGTP